MYGCRWTKNVERWFDGELRDGSAVERHVAQCPQCRGHLASLDVMRKASVAGVRADSIADAQFPAFLAGIREGVEAPRRGHRRIWAALSLTAAALLVALSFFVIFHEGHAPVDATVVESYSTGLDSATITSYSSDDGVTTVWVTVSKEDVW